MPGLAPTVHVQIEEYLKKSFPAHQVLFRTYDTVEALPDIQIRTVIIRGSRGLGEDFYCCAQSIVDYTKYVHGEPDYEMNFKTFNLPANAIKELVIDHLRHLESEVRDSRDQEDPNEWFGGGIELDEEQEAEEANEAMDEESQ